MNEKMMGKVSKKTKENLGKYGQIVLQDWEFDTENIVSFDVVIADELVDAVEKQRKEKGYTDSVYDDNEVYYNIYLQIDFSEKSLKLSAVCNHGEHDDYAEYQLPLTDEEERLILFNAIETLMDEQLESFWDGSAGKLGNSIDE